MSRDLTFIARNIWIILLKVEYIREITPNFLPTPPTKN